MRIISIGTPLTQSVIRLWVDCPLCLADCFSACRRRSGLRQGKPGSKMLAEGGKMPEELSFGKKNR